MLRCGWPGLVVLVVQLVVACGGGGGSPTGPAMQTVGPAGGTLRALGADGTVFTLEVPAAALHDDVLITLEPVEGVPASLAAARITPPTLSFAVPAIFTVEPGAAVAMSPSPWLGLGPASSRTPLPTSVAREGRALQTQLRFVDIDALAAAGAIATAQDGEGGEISAFESSCRAQLDATKPILEGFLATNNYPAALRTILATAALAANCGIDEEVGDWLHDTETVACARYDDLVLLARSVAADTYDTFIELIDPLSNWAGELETLGADCPDPPLNAVLGEKYAQFYTFYSAVVADSMTSDYEDIVDEVSKVHTLRGRASTLGLDDAEQQLEQQILYPLMDLLRDKAYALCNSEDDHYYLSGLLRATFEARRAPIGSMTAAGLSWPAFAPQDAHAAFKDRDLHGDLQYCASSAQFEVWAGADVPFQVTEQSRELDGGAEPGGGTRTAAALAPIEGHLVLQGDIAAFRCGQSRTLEDDELVVEFEAQEVERAASSGGAMWQGPREIEVQELVDAASFDPKALNSGDFVLERHSGACGGDYGEAEFDLFTVDLTIDPKPTASSVSAGAASLVADATTPVVFTIPFEDRGTNLAKLAAHYVLAEKEQAFEIALPGSEGVAGFDAATGSGTYTADITVFCSEEPRNPLQVRIRLIDAFEQESDEVVTSLAVDYGGCQGAEDGSRAAAIDPQGFAVRLHSGDR